MKKRSITSIIGIALALILLFSALPLQAQTNTNVSISNLRYEGVAPDSNQMVLSWDTIANTWYASLQVKGGGLVDTWTSLSNLSLTIDGSKTYLYFDDLSDMQVAGTIYNFRVKVTLTDGSSTRWAQVDQS